MNERERASATRRRRRAANRTDTPTTPSQVKAALVEIQRHLREARDIAYTLPGEQQVLLLQQALTGLQSLNQIHIHNHCTHHNLPRAAS